MSAPIINTSPKTTIPPDKENNEHGAYDPLADPNVFWPDPEEIIEDSLHKFYAINALTRKRSKIPTTEALKEAETIVSLPYAEQITSPITEVITENEAAKKVLEALK